jgi:hypothetical protein
LNTEFMKRKTPAHRRLAVIGHAPTGHPRTFRLEPAPDVTSSRNAAYRRLAAAILELDVPTLARRLTHLRLDTPESDAA